MRSNKKGRKSRRSRRKSTRRKRGGGTMNDMSKKILFCRLHGGLGNQIFMYAAGLAIKDLLGMPLILIRAYDNPHSQTKYTPFFKGGEDRDLSVVQARFDNAVKMPEKIGQNSPEFMSKLPEYKKGDCKLQGEYYHDFKLVEPVIPKIKSDFIGELAKRYPDFKANILNGYSEDKMFFMHVRMGDHNALGWSSPVEYFSSALAALGDIPDVIHVISNDIPFCKKQIEEGKWKSSKLRIFEDTDELKTMYLMSLCKGGVILSASTFSWWGAIFGPHENPNSTIIYPKEALNNQNNRFTFPERTGKKWMTVPE